MRSTVRAWLALVALSLAVLLPAHVGAQAPSTPPAPTEPASCPAPSASSPAAPADPGAASIALTSQTPFVAPTDQLRMTFDIANAPEGAGLVFELRSPITPQADPRRTFEEYLAGRTPTEVFGRTPDGPMLLAFTPIDANGDAQVDLSIVPPPDIPQLGFRIPDPGVYPLIVSLVAGEDRAVLDKLTTFVNRLPGADVKNAPPPINVASIVPFRAPLAFGTDLSTAMPADVQRCLSALATAAAQAPSALPVTVAANPETVVALDHLPDQDPAVAQLRSPELAQRWRGRSLLGATYVPVDLTAWADANLRDLLRDQLALGSATLQQRLQPAAPVADRIWLGDAPASAAALRMLKDAGRNQVVVPSGWVSPIDTSPTAYRPEQAQVVRHQPFELDLGGTTVRAVTADDALRSQLNGSNEPALNAQIALTDLALTYFGDQRPLVTNATAPNTATLQRSTVVIAPTDANGLASFNAFTAGLARPTTGDAKPVVAGANLPTIFAAPAAAAPTPRTEPLVRGYHPPATPATDMGDYAREVADADDALLGYSSMVQHTAPQTIGPLVQAVDVSADRSLDATERQNYLDASNNTAHLTTSNVQLLPQERITLAAKEAELKVPLDNRNEFPVAVKVTLTSDAKLAFQNGESMQSFETTLQPGRNDLPINVVARSAGAFTVDVAVTTPDDRTPIASSKFEVRSSVFSGLGLFVTVGAGFFLMVWWARNFRKSRRAAKLIDPTEPSPGQDDDAPPNDDPRPATVAASG